MRDKNLNPKLQSVTNLKKTEFGQKSDRQETQLKDQLARALADYDNFRKRTEREREELRFVLARRIVARFLPVLDMLYEAQKHLSDSGIALTISSFEEALKSEGIEKIEPCKGDVFDPELHEAVEVEKRDDLKDNQIVECVLRGWKFSQGQVVRHAKVAVNKLGEK